MEIIKIIGIGLVGAVISVMLRNLKPEFAMMIPVVVTFTVLMCVMPYLVVIVEEIRTIASGAGINSEYIVIILKIIGVSYLAGISAELCKDAGENAVASKIELAGKLIIMFMSMPIINNLIGVVKGIIMR